jgi:phytoene desaturase
MEQKKAVVIGSGVAGLAASIRLAQGGYRCTVLEANDFPGGKLSQFQLGAYRFDAGPSLFTLPELVDELFELCGKNARDYFQYLSLDSICRYHYPDGSSFTAETNRQQFAESLRSIASPEEIQAFFQQLDEASWKYQRTASLFLDQSLHQVQNYFNLKTLRGMLGMPRLNLFETMHRENQRRVQNPKLVQYLNRYATYNGSDPYRAPALLNLIPHLEHNQGTYFPVGGMNRITQALYQLAMEMGVEFRFESPAQEILCHNKKTRGVRYYDHHHQQSQDIEADLVVSNADVFQTYRKLLPGVPAPTKILNQEKSSSAVVFYWGMRQSFPDLKLHNIFFAADYQAEFKAIFETKELHPDPTVYINISSKCEPADAPEGGENWFVMINVPAADQSPIPNLVEKARSLVLGKLSHMTGVDLASLVEEESYLDPARIEARTSSNGGALYGNASNNRFAAFLRHKNFHSDIKGLYFCGGSAHPGGGIPLCLKSAKIACEIAASRH